MRNIILLLLLALLAVPLQAQAEAASSLRTLEHDGLDRNYVLSMPDNAEKLLIVLHPFASSGHAMEHITGLSESAGEAGYAVAYPNSVGFYWDDGRNANGYALPPAREAVDDLGFLAALIEDVTTDSEIDPNSVYITGLANGGTMALTAACERPDLFAGAVIVSALMWNYQMEACAETGEAVDMLFIHGRKDPTYRIIGNDFQEDTPYSISSAQATVDFWQVRNSCDRSVVESYEQTTLLMYTACDDEARLGFLGVVDGGTDWFRSGYRVNAQIGINASEVLVAFLERDGTLVETTQQGSLEPTSVRPRGWLLYVPTSYDPAEPMPLMVLLHGRTVTNIHQAWASNMNEIAEREGFIAVYPDGLDTQWNYTRGIPEYGNLAQDDDQFLFDLQDDLEQDLNIDSQRVYVTGLSNGGFMTQRLLCTGDDRYAAGASVAATAGEGLSEQCEGARPVPMMYIHGTEDTIVPWAGLPVNVGGQARFASLPMDLSATFWATHNSCDPTFQREALPQLDENTETQILRFENCPENVDLQVYAVVGGGHVWPGVRDFEDALLGEVSMDFNASEVIWEFVSQFTLDMRPEPVERDTDTAGRQQVIELLQTGGYVILVQPFETELGATTCEDGYEGVLSEAGLAQVEILMTALNDLEIPIGNVLSNSDCASSASAIAAFGEIEADFDLDGPGLALILSLPPEEGTNNVMFADSQLVLVQGSRTLTPGGTFIVVPQSDQQFELLLPLTPEGWQDLAAFYTESQASEE